ncbi:MAG: hypothetical protein UFA98_03095 [Ruminococcus sp.]|nr:hypothetical protein [Ruminococcus sp.]
MERNKRCPYCGKRVPYFSAYMSRRKAEYTCVRCGKESRVIIIKAVIVSFIICLVLSLSIFAAWIIMKMTSNPLGIVAVAFPLIVFLLISPKYVRFEPLKKYKNSMEARKAGLEYSDSFAISSIDDEKTTVSDATGQFKINEDVFNKIKSERGASKEQAESENIVSHSDHVEATKPGESYVPVNESVRNRHASDSAPLKKIHSEGTRINRVRHYIPAPQSEEETVTETRD